ncbi:MAG: flagellar basal body L-ring protein FlgH [Arcobacteraceae bacterium]|nr:flagellar basal body L-ring protein FlgH [Arcobacteraceae bacterium]
MKHNKISLLLIVPLFFIGCSAKQKIDLDSKPENQFPVSNSKKEEQSFKGSLYSQAGTSLFADKKDLQIGDILQVNISETLTKNSKSTKDLAKNTTSSLGGGVFAGATGVTNSAGTAARIGRVNNALGIGFDSTSANSFSGSSTLKDNEAFTTVVSVVITNIYQNGNYFIKGTKELLINDEKQQISISGIIRPYDISPENTVLSSQVANLKILYDKEGDGSDTLEKPWGTKFIEKIWPF